MLHPELSNYANHAELSQLVDEFDAGIISRTDFQQRSRALPNELLVVLSEILIAGPVFRRAAAGASDSQWRS
jgi:hypothetical protein